MILEKSHGKEKRYAARDISEAVLQRGTVPGASGISMLADWVCLPPVRRPAWVSATQRAVSMRPLQTPDLRDGRDNADKTHMPLSVCFLLFTWSGQINGGSPLYNFRASLE